MLKKCVNIWLWLRLEKLIIVIILKVNFSYIAQTLKAKYIKT
jgi:hypothetical protein